MRRTLKLRNSPIPTDVFTLANIVTLIRIFIIAPLCIYHLLSKNKFLFVLFIVIFFILDKVDGYLARKLNQVTYIGKILDGLSDTLGLVIIMAYFFLNSILSLSELAIIILPRLLYYVFVFYYQHKHKQLVQTFVWKWVLMAWLLLFSLLFFLEHNTAIIVSLTSVIYLTTAWHFTIVFRKVHYDLNSKLITK